VKLWEMGTGQELLTLRDHVNSVRGVAFGRDGQRLTSISLEGAVKVWEAVPPSPERVLQRKASRLVNSLFTRGPGGTKARVLAHLRADTTLSEPLRRAALAIAEQYPVPR
jgi:WD40 repeat protein